MRIFSTVRCTASLMLMIAVVGCGESKPPAGSVTGAVTFNGKPVTAGTVNFLSSTGSAAVAKLDASGRYKVEDPVSPGEYKVFVMPPMPEPQPPGTPPAPLPKFDVSAKFRDPISSGVKVTVNTGENDIPVTLKD